MRTQPQTGNEVQADAAAGGGVFASWLEVRAARRRRTRRRGRLRYVGRRAELQAI